MIGAKIGIGIAGLALTGWAASQSWVGAIILCVLLAAIIFVMMLMLKVERTQPATESPVYSAHPVPQMNPGSSATAIPGSSRAISAPRSLHLHFHGVDQVQEAIRSLPQ